MYHLFNLMWKTRSRFTETVSHVGMQESYKDGVSSQPLSWVDIRFWKLYVRRRLAVSVLAY